MNDRPLVSVIIAAYRADHYLEEAIRDALGQTYPAVEIIVSDDAALPETEAAVTRLAAGRVTYRRNPVRLGPAGNHWAALRAAQGDLIAILNHDDRWAPEFLAKLVPPLIADPDVVLAFCDHHVIGPDGRSDPARTAANSARWGRDRLVSGKCIDLPGLVARQAVPLAMGSVFRRSALDLEALPGDAGPAYDLWLAYLLASGGGAAYYVPDRLTSWREHPVSLTAQAGRDWAEGAIRCWERMLADPHFAAHKAVIRRSLSAGYRSTARSALRSGELKAARSAAAAALRVRLTDPKAAALFGLSFTPARLRRWAGC